MFLSFFSALSYSESKPGIFKKVFDSNILKIDVSGSSKQYINGSIQMTKPEYAVYPFDKSYDWCSNCGKTYDEHPFIIFSLSSKKFKFNSYFVRCGCCYNGCCCEEYGYTVHCCLYSWSLQISDDNKTWTTVHNVEKDRQMRDCNEKTFDLDKYYTAKYVRLIQDEHCPGYPPCIAINKFELYGDTVNSETDESDEFVSYHDDDDDVSIIGHISKNGNVRN